MKRVMVIVTVAVASLAFVQGALAVTPSITSVAASTDLHPSATFSAPSASSVSIYFATQPGQASDGSFFQENVKRIDFMTTAEIAAGSWKFEDQLNPGTYYALLKASPNFSTCYVSGGTYKPECANGYSNVVKLVVPVPPASYSVVVSAPKFSSSAFVKFKATPLGVREQFRACFKARSKRTICVHGILSGYSWKSKATGTVNIAKQNLHSPATLRFYIGAKQVAAKTFRFLRSS